MKKVISSTRALKFERWCILLHPWTHSQSPSIPTSALKKSYSLSLSLCEFLFQFTRVLNFLIYIFQTFQIREQFEWIFHFRNRRAFNKCLCKSTSYSISHSDISRFPFIFLFLRFQLLILLRHSFSPDRLLCKFLLCNYSMHFLGNLICWVLSVESMWYLMQIMCLLLWF